MDAAWDAVRLAKYPRVHIFIATSQIHMEYKLKMTPDQVCLILSGGMPSWNADPDNFCKFVLTKLQVSASSDSPAAFVVHKSL